MSRLPTETWLSMIVEVVNGKKPGPCIWLSAALHGDELNGVEIIRRVLNRLKTEDLRGCVIAVPIVNVFGFIEQSRYLPDRRDLNRSFPGSHRGSLAGRIAHLFMTEIVTQCDFGIDLHTGSNYRENLPQIRAKLDDPQTRKCAKAFGAPVMIHAAVRDGSLRHAASSRGIPVLLYEAGEPLRFERDSIEIGVRGILRVMRTLKMLRSAPKTRFTNPLAIQETTWIRARRGGILNLDVSLGQRVTKSQRLGIIADAFGDNSKILRASTDGIVIGVLNNPIVNQGDAVVHLGRLKPDERMDNPDGMESFAY
ncbi:MAG: succinylglutamate desuccinylase/aspartoacylase family protein [Planctomycetaceae bacterium]